MRADRSTPTRRRAYGATSGPHRPVPHPASSTSRLFDRCRRSESASIAATSAGARYNSLASLASKLPAKLSNVCSMNASDARAGTSRPEHAAIMCRAMGWSGSSLSHSSKTATASSTSPSVQCASASSLRASGCFGLNVMTLQKQTTASCVRFCAVQQDAEVGVRVGMLGTRANGGSIGGFRFDDAALRPQQDAEIVVRIGMIRIERNRVLARGDGLIQLESIPQDDRRDCCTSPPGRARARGFSRSA